MNRPFFSTNTNTIDETVCKSAPTNLNGQNVLVSQEQQRQISDTLNTSIMGLPLDNTPNTPSGYLQSQKHFVPGGISFTFTSQPNPQGFSAQKMCSSPLQYNQPMAQGPTTLEEQMAWSELQKHALQIIQLQQLMRKNPFLLRFHQDEATSTLDLLNCITQVPNSQGTPDFTNISGVVPLTALQNIEFTNKGLCNSFENYPKVDFPLPPMEFSSNAKKLVLSTIPTRSPGHVMDALEPPNKKQVSFVDDVENNEKCFVDESCQTLMECHCNLRNHFQCKTKRKRKRSRSPLRRSKTDSESTDEDSISSGSDNCGSCNRKPRRRQNKRRKYRRRARKANEYDCDLD